MTDKCECKEEQKKPAKRIISEGRGKYSILVEDRVYNFEFPIDATILKNYEVISFLKDEIWNAMEKKKEEDKAAEEKIANAEKVTPISEEKKD